MVPYTVLSYFQIALEKGWPQGLVVLSCGSCSEVQELLLQPAMQVHRLQTSSCPNRPPASNTTATPPPPAVHNHSNTSLVAFLVNKSGCLMWCHEGSGVLNTWHLSVIPRDLILVLPCNSYGAAPF